jgi:hypothetical protein
MSSERRTTVYRNNGRRSSGPRTKAGKVRASRNALQHGLAAISQGQSIPSGKIARLADAICGDDSDPALLAQAQVIAQNEMVLRAIREQQIAVVERLREPTAIALTKRDNSLKLAKARSKQTRRAVKEIERHLPSVLEKYRDRLQPEDFDPSPYDLVPLGLKVLLEEPDSLEEEQRALDLAWKQIEQQQRDEHEAMQEAIPDLIRLERYERRAWSRQQRAIREFLNIKFMRNLPVMAAKQSSR